MPGDSAAQDEVGYRAGGVDRELNHGPPPAPRDRLPTGRRRRVQHDQRVPLVQGVKHGLHGRVPEVQAAGVGFQHHAVGVQHIAGVGDLGQRALDIGQRQRCQEGEPVRVLAGYARVRNAVRSTPSSG